MNRRIRAITALGLTLTLSVLAGAGIAGAQEMEHGRTRPVSRELQSNVVKTQNSIDKSFANNVRG